jgi:hypothetical protein
MDKTKAKLAATNLAAFFDNDDDESSFSVRWIEPLSLPVPLTNR